MHDSQGEVTKTKSLSRWLQWAVMVAIGCGIAALAVFSNDLPRMFQFSGGTVMFMVLTIGLTARVLEVYWRVARSMRFWLALLTFLAIHAAIWLSIRSMVRIWAYVIIVLVEFVLFDLALRRSLKLNDPSRITT